jgi:hypothetical protein
MTLLPRRDNRRQIYLRLVTRVFDGLGTRENFSVADAQTAGQGQSSRIITHTTGCVLSRRSFGDVATHPTAVIGVEGNT